MQYDSSLTLIWTDAQGSDHVERYATSSAYLTRIEELESQGATVVQ
jgi:hypothetical protein